ATLMGSAVRVAGGWISDRIGGIATLTGVLLMVAASLVLCGLASASLPATTLLFMLCFAALGAGNGALFQLVPLRWPLSTAVAGGPPAPWRRAERGHEEVAPGDGWQRHGRRAHARRAAPARARALRDHRVRRRAASELQPHPLVAGARRRAELRRDRAQPAR